MFESNPVEKKEAKVKTFATNPQISKMQLISER